MVIMIRCYKVVDNRCVYPGKALNKYPNDHDFGFDIYQPKNWYRWLMANDYQKIPGEGLPVAIWVYKIGCVGRTSQGEKKGGILSLFPGFDEHGKSRPPAKFGRLK